MPRSCHRVAPRVQLAVAAALLGASLLALGWKVASLYGPDPESGVARFLEKRGPGLHHLGYGSTDVTADSRRLMEQGLVLIDLGQDPNRLTAAFYQQKSAGGILTYFVPARDH